MNRINPFFEADSNSYSLTMVEYSHFELEYYVFHSGKAPIISVWDTKLETYNGIGMIYYMEDVSDIKEDVIDTIDEVVGRNWGNEVIGNNFTLMSVIVEPEMCYITSDNDLAKGKEKAISDSSMQMKTSEFRQVSMKWLEFLESLNK
jgi:hypothetical protein